MQNNLKKIMEENNPYVLKESKRQNVNKSNRDNGIRDHMEKNNPYVLREDSKILSLSPKKCR